MDDIASNAGLHPAKAFLDRVHKAWKEMSEKDKHANILILGKTGVGKSTLINAIFRDNLTKTGTGRPVTPGIIEVTKPGMPLTILDSKGLELADYAALKDALLAEIRARQGEDPNRYVNLAWLCISEPGQRIEEAEIDIAKALKEMGVDVIAVLTKVGSFKNYEFQKAVEKELAGVCQDIILTRALEERLEDDDGNHLVRKVAGLDELIACSYRYIPESQRRSFVNALSMKNKKAIAVKQAESRNIIDVAAGTAAAAAALPIPFSDAIALAPIQIAMILKISHIFGMQVDESSIMPVVSSLLGAGAATMIGRTLVGAILKFIPGIGSVVGGIISASTAGMLTRQMGVIYLDLLVELAEQGRSLSLEDTLGLLKGKLGM
jgi:uncharacterized protein (DUF697 family)/GTP-binding protein EngB required for normal cell division